MREKLVAIIFIFIILFASLPIVSSNQSTKTSPSEEIMEIGSPDLICYMELVKIQEWHYLNYSLTNIGNAPATNCSINVTIYPFGIYLFHNSFFYLLEQILPPSIFFIIMNTLIEFFHIWPTYLMGEYRFFFQPINPSETITRTSFFPVDAGLEGLHNAQLCLIIEVIADKIGIVDESNELNNKAVMRWWFPLKTDPP